MRHHSLGTEGLEVSGYPTPLFSCSCWPPHSLPHPSNVAVPLHLLSRASSPTLEALAVHTHPAPSCPEPRTLGPSAAQAGPPGRPTGTPASAWPAHPLPKFLASENGITTTTTSTTTAPPELELGVIHAQPSHPRHLPLTPTCNWSSTL